MASSQNARKKSRGYFVVIWEDNGENKVSLGINYERSDNWRIVKIFADNTSRDLQKQLVATFGNLLYSGDFLGGYYGDSCFVSRVTFQRIARWLKRKMGS